MVNKCEDVPDEDEDEKESDDVEADLQVVKTQNAANKRLILHPQFIVPQNGSKPRVHTSKTLIGPLCLLTNPHSILNLSLILHQVCLSHPLLLRRTLCHMLSRPPSLLCRSQTPPPMPLWALPLQRLRAFGAYPLAGNHVQPEKRLRWERVNGNGRRISSSIAMIRISGAVRAIKSQRLITGRLAASCSHWCTPPRCLRSQSASAVLGGNATMFLLSFADARNSDIPSANTAFTPVFLQY